MISLYVKTHNKTGLKYFGKTIKEHVDWYKGSGIYWSNHIKKHGNDVTTEIIFQTDDVEEAKRVALAFSKEYNITKSNEWANLQDENGTDGAPEGHQFNVGKIYSPEHRRNIAKASVGNTNVRGKAWWYHPESDTGARANECPGDGWIKGMRPPNKERSERIKTALSGKPKSIEHRKALSEAAKRRPSNTKGTVWVVNEEGIRRRVTPDSIPKGFKRVTDR